MASLKVKFRASTIEGKEGSIYYQIIHERKIRYIATAYRIYSWEWDEKRSTVTSTSQSSRKNEIMSIREKIRRDKERFTKIRRKLEAESLSYTADDVKDEFSRYSREFTLCRYTQNLIMKLRISGKIRTSETYCAALRSFRKFREGKDVMLDSLTAETITGYQNWLAAKGLTPNSISFYNRILRAVYNRAVSEGITENRHPFRNAYTGIGKTIKRALSIETIKKIRKLRLPKGSVTEYARNMFMMSFYLRGMSFIDLAYLRKSDLRDGHITYYRRKTGQLLNIKWTKEMSRILAKYPENETDYLLPIIRCRKSHELYCYRNVAGSINLHLKEIARKIGLEIPLTLYVARHSWASAARTKGIPIGIISEGMGHDSEASTRIYLSSIDTSAVDKANELIIQSV